MSTRAPGAMPLVLGFGDVGAGALGLVGGKGANLAWMAQAGLPVPPGFCVTTAAFRRFVGRDIEPLYAELEALDPGDVEGTRVTAARVRDALGRLPVPPEVADAVTAAWRAASGPDHAWAIRSSATAEDLPGASFAGQQDTFLNVRGERALRGAVRDCWVSLFTDRAVLTTPLRIPPLRTLLLGIFGAVYPQIPDALRPLLGRLGPDRWPSIAGATAMLRLLGPALPRVAAALVVWPVEQLAPRADAAVARILDGLGPLHSPRALRDRLVVLFPSVPTVAPPIVAGLLARRVLAALGVPEPALQPVLRALPHNGTTEMDLALADLGDRVRPHPALAESLARTGLAGAAGHPEAKPFLEGFRAFQARYGMRGAGEIDLSRPRWRDEPRMLLSVILGGLTGGDAGAHRRRHAAMATDAEAAIDRIVRETPWWRRVVVRRLLRVVRAGLGLREHPKYLIVHVLERAREVATATGKALAASDALAQADDVWFPTWDELVARVRGRLGAARDRHGAPRGVRSRPEATAAARRRERRRDSPRDRACRSAAERHRRRRRLGRRRGGSGARAPRSGVGGAARRRDPRRAVHRPGLDAALSRTRPASPPRSAA